MTDKELLERPDDNAALRERLRRSEARLVKSEERAAVLTEERDAATDLRDAMAAERDAAVLAACQVLMIADGYAMMRERKLLRHMTCSAQHRLLGF